ncbi:Uncharacterized protein DBV15_01040 [Temnothorax longispinosus]|uniref:Uncharacterized protein n=1 Tax=Temnothorax longispinosus TaxID=300112 RepID=A0A4S2JCK0_9HYME|nr:Uncharacterized protein DBV15_01040 [Temnothorax longispinosus]
MRKIPTAKIAAHRSDLGASSSPREQYVRACNSTSYVLITGRGRATSEEVEDFAALITEWRYTLSADSAEYAWPMRRADDLKRDNISRGEAHEGENDADGSLNNAVGVVGCLQDAGNNVARAAYNSLRIMCTTRRWGSAKVTLPAGCLLLSQRGLAAYNEIGEEERARACDGRFKNDLRSDT